MHRVLPFRATLTLLLSAGLLAPAPASAQSLQTGESKHYTVHTNLSSREVKPLVQHMDAVYASYLRLFKNFRSQTGAREPLYLVRNQNDYMSFLASQGINAAGSGGMFYVYGGANNSGLITWVDDKPLSFTLETLQHEGFHQFAWDRLGPTLPLWANEGLAEYFGYARMDKRGKLVTGLTPGSAVRPIKQAVEQGQAMPIRELVYITSQQWGANLRSGDPIGHIQYAQSWAMVHFLLNADRQKHRKPFFKYLELISKRSDPTRAWNESFGPDVIDALEARWRTYVLEELEVDPHSTAVERLQLVGSWMNRRRLADQPIPETLDDMRKAMLADGVDRALAQIQGHGNRQRADPDDDPLSYLDPQGQRQPFVLLRKPGPEGLPELAAEAFRPKPTLKWLRRGDKLDPLVVDR
ncbi:MAG: DUF1570 domain-containing protein [Planctomycetota bacterium]